MPYRLAGRKERIAQLIEGHQQIRGNTSGNTASAYTTCKKRPNSLLLLGEQVSLYLTVAPQKMGQ